MDALARILRKSYCLFLPFFCILLLANCKDNEKVSQESRQFPSIPSGGYAIAPSEELASMGDFFPMIWDDPYELNLGLMPASGQATRLPYSGWWYPFDEGGTNVDITGSGLSPLEKYDRAFNPPGSSAAWESRHHGSGQSWFGHCNGFAAASQRHDEPTKPVTVNGITFAPEEVKALLAEIYMKAIPIFIGGRRCFETGEVNENWSTRRDPQFMGRCEDINPGIFHAGISNVIGRKNQVMVMDLAANDQVWNFPIFRYSSTQIPVTEMEASRLITGALTSYPFNRRAREFFHVRTTVYARDFGGEERIYGPTGLVKQELFEYILELDENKVIVGGEWVGASIKRHPDFLWIALQPLRFEASRIDIQENSPVNPFVDPVHVLRLWAEAAGYDPDSPPEEIMMPTDNEVRLWGKFDHFLVTLDGNDRGVAFTGKPLRVVLTRTEKLVGEVQISVSLNKGVMAQQALKADLSFVSFEVEPLAGINSLDVILHREEAILEEKRLLFHGVP